MAMTSPLPIGSEQLLRHRPYRHACVRVVSNNEAEHTRTCERRHDWYESVTPQAGTTLPLQPLPRTQALPTPVQAVAKAVYRRVSIPSQL